jgi:Ni,Fe-hydrogenase III large subunit
MTASSGLLALKNGEHAPLAGLVPLPFDVFRNGLFTDIAAGARVAALFGQPWDGRLRLHAIVADGSSGELRWRTTEVGASYPSLTPECPQVHWFEREIAEQWGVHPEGHPWLKPIRFHHSYREGVDAWERSGSQEILPAVTDFFQVQGVEVHEVAVGPVHAGVIEPGHFRFQCHGEQVFHLEISLGYQHRGIERAMTGGPDKRTIHLMENIAGDTTVGHSLAFTQAVEALTDVRVSPAAETIRTIALELERLANHTGDLGALANDIGYLPTASYCGRIRGDFLNMTALLCGNRFGRGIVRPGGLGVMPDKSAPRELRKRLDTALADAANAVDLLWRTPSVRARFENAGFLSQETSQEVGLVGVPARSCGLPRDARHEFPAGGYAGRSFQVSTHPDGNVHSRAWVRWLEIGSSGDLIRELLESPALVDLGCPAGAQRGSVKPEAGVVTMVEGWRGEICHVALTDTSGKFVLYKVVDPSFHNWMGLALALRNQRISDFPLCNKSFNLSYCGHDL